MEFKISTYDIQDLVIALISYRADEVITQEDKDRMIDKLTEMNNLCTKENDYTLSVQVKKTNQEDD